MSWQTAATESWLSRLPGVEREHPLARHTSFNIGGPAEWFVELAGADDLARVADGCRERAIPCRFLGAGTNLLVGDGGVRGLVVRVVNRDFAVGGDRVRAGAGLKMMRLARLAADRDLVGFEFAIGVPGTVGGAVYQDAGCWGRELREVLEEVEGYVPGEGPRRWAARDLALGYRTSAFRDGALRGALITAATVRLQPGDGAASRREMQRLTAERNRSQPIRTKNCGSVFKNPPGDSAGRLVEVAGMKGAREGGAHVAEQHANFIVNDGGATARDVRALVERIQERVRSIAGIDLETEVEMIGTFD